METMIIDNVSLNIWNLLNDENKLLFLKAVSDAQKSDDFKSNSLENYIESAEDDLKHKNYSSFTNFVIEKIKQQLLKEIQNGKEIKELLENNIEVKKIKIKY